ncbi:class A beta-lactamase [Gordonia sp. HY442]|uniref:class A beta-lactamase n=1 Tax=Gordonia zhenghanii TaxID=2911516 RepID=UPI001EFF4841|nr:class A beta-lactamase [Gordonia zhenghanii]MCF8603994.1 class A beta-lactamase [Gordonia zhenghanii]
MSRKNDKPSYAMIATWLAVALLLPLVATACGSTTESAPSALRDDAYFASLEQRYGARIGVHAIDTGDDTTLSYRSSTRFAYASTSKALTSALVLQTASDAELSKVVRYSPDDLLSYAPVTSQHVDTGMTLHDIVVAAVQYSDNTAANLLTSFLGGPAAVQAKLREIGDDTTRVDRIEPDLNSAIRGDARDTTTAAAMATDLKTFALGSLLPEPRRDLYNTILEGNTTGADYIQAGVPEGSVVGDKTGSGDFGTRNDVAVVRPPGRAPIVLAIFTDRPGDQSAQSDDSLIADVTRHVMPMIEA